MRIVKNNNIFIEKKNLSNISKLITDGTHYTPNNTFDISDFPFFTVKDLKKGKFDFDNCSRISKEDFNYAKKMNSVPIAGDVLFSKDGTVGKVYVVKDGMFFAVLSSFAILRLKNNMSSNYISFCLKNKPTLNSIKKNKTGSALKRIVLKDLKKISINIPNFTQQTKIANLLDKQQLLIDSYKEKLYILKQQEQYYQNKLLSGDIRIKLNQNSHNYAIEQVWIDSNSEIIADQKDEFEDWLRNSFSGKVEFYKNKNWENKKINGVNKNIPVDWFSCSSVEEKEINKNSKIKIIKSGLSYFEGVKKYYPTKEIDTNHLTGNHQIITFENRPSRANMEPVQNSSWCARMKNTGKFLYFQNNFSPIVLSTGMFGLKSLDNYVQDKYIYHYIQTDNFQKYKNLLSSGTTQEAISNEKIKFLNIACPNKNTEQILIVNILDNFINQKDNLNQKIQLEEQKMDYLMDKLLNGELQVVD